MAFKIEEAYGTFESRLAELRKQAHSEERRQNGTIAFFDKDGKYIGLVEFPTAGKRGFINIGIRKIIDINIDSKLKDLIIKKQ